MSLQQTALHGEGRENAAMTKKTTTVRRASKGFSLIELVIVVVIIGIIAAIAIPRMSRGSAGAADSALAQNLSVLRNALDMYQTEHNGSYPGGTSAQVSAQLTQYSDISGTNVQSTKDTGAAQIIYGPYLRSIPPITVGANKGLNAFSISATAGTPATPAAGIAWLYNSADGTITANATGNDSAGHPYGSY